MSNDAKLIEAKRERTLSNSARLSAELSVVDPFLRHLKPEFFSFALALECISHRIENFRLVLAVGTPIHTDPESPPARCFEAVGR